MNALSHERRSPVERFLGSEEASGGPFALLGVPPAACTDEAILAALDRQLERVNRTTECDTPEADEVRLALHAAAAQLLDPAVRRHLTARWTGRPVPHPRMPTLSEPAQRSPDRVRLEHDAVLTLGLFGGWNRRSLHRLVALAHARGYSSEHVAQTLRGLAGRRRPRPVAARSIRVEKSSSVRGGAAPLPEEVDPARVLLRNALIVGAAGVFTLALVIGLLVHVLTKHPSSAPAPPPAGSPPASAAPRQALSPPPASDGGGSQRVNAATARPADQLGALAAALRELAACPDALAVDPVQAAARFESAIGVLASGWPRVPRDRLIAAQDSIVEFLYRVGHDPALAARSLAAVGAGAESLASPREFGPGANPDRVWPAVWSVAMLVRLARERDFSVAARDAVEACLARALGPSAASVERTFDAGSVAALLALPRAMLASPPSPLPAEPWSRWADAAEAAEQDRARRERILLAGLEALLLLGPEPNADRGVLEIVTMLAARPAWRRGDESRRWLVRLFDDRRVSAADLNAVTAALATRSAAEGVDLTMVLSASASDRVRADLRDRFARVWGVTLDVDRSALAAEWARGAADAVERSHRAANPVEHLASAVILARINGSAWRLWGGEHAPAAEILKDPARDVDAVVAPPSAPAGPPDAGDGAWAERYLAARRNVPLRLEQLGRLAGRGRAIGPVDAEVLVNEALAGSPNEVRTRAVDLVRTLADSPAIVNAVLETLPRTPRQVPAGQLIAYVCQRRLPMVRDPAWSAAARRALVERLLELRAAEGEHGAIDRLSVLMASAYRELASDAPLSEAQRNEASQPPADQSAAAVRARWRDAAGRLPPIPRAPSTWGLDALDRRHAGRVSVARGQVQAFVAEQLGGVEALAFLVAAEQPAHADEIRSILDELEAERRAARHVFEQVAALERAATLLWRVRFGEPPP